jgi:hypothetical protein
MIPKDLNTVLARYFDREFQDSSALDLMHPERVINRRAALYGRFNAWSDKSDWCLKSGPEFYFPFTLG